MTIQNDPAIRDTVDVSTTAFSVTIAVETPIAAPPARVWSVLTDFEDYPSWNPQITRWQGAFEVGARLEVLLQLPGRRPITMKPRIVELEPGRRYAWLGRVGVPGLVDGRHSFEVRPVGDHTVFVHREHLAGALVPPFRRLLTGPTPEAFLQMSEALKQRSEARD